MDEFTREKLMEELHGVREQLRALRQEIMALEERVLRGEAAKEVELARARDRLEGLRPRHDELADLLEGPIEAPGRSGAGLLDFLADYKWPLIGVAAMSVVVGLMFLVSRPQVTADERAKVQKAITGVVVEQVQTQAETAQDRMHREVRRAERGQ